MRQLQLKNGAWRLLVALAMTLVAGVSRVMAAPLQVGPGKPYATPCDAVAAAKASDEIEISPGTYTDSCALALSGLTLRGTGGRPKIDLSATDHPAQYKGIYVVTADDVTIENLELTGAHISPDNGANAAAIRVEAKGLTVRGCQIHDNQNGVLGGTSGTLTIEHSELFHNGLGDGCNQDGCTHNVYVANIDTLYFRFNWSHEIATDTPDKGHLLKSRAKANYILYNRLTGESGFDSYEIDLPNGGLAVLVGNLIQKGKAAGNSILFSWGEEGANNADKRVFLANNTFVNDLGSGTFVRAQGATLSAKNNLFVGAGTVSSGGALSADNLSGLDPSFIDRAGFDYHLSAGSAAIGKGVAAGSADQFSLTPVSEYLHPLAEATRVSARDVGAYEYGTSSSRADAGVGRSDAGGAASDAGTMRQDAGTSDGGVSTGDADQGDQPEDGDPSNPDEPEDADAGKGSAHGSGCSLASADAGNADQALLLCLLLALLVTKRRRAGLHGFVATLTLLGCSGSLESKDAARDASEETVLDGASEDEDEDAGEEVAAGRDAAQVAHDAGVSATDASSQGSSTDGGSALCPGLGWCELSNTKLVSVCPDPKQFAEIQANEGCGGVINDWSGGMADEKRNRLLVWGGGHRGYFGNEVYALDLNTLTMRRLNQPSDVSSIDLSQCTSPEAYADGRPAARHTYDGLAYLPDADKMFSLAGSGIPCGYGVQGTWTLDLAAVDTTPLGGAAPWRQMKPATIPSKAAYGVVSDYDPKTKRVIVNDTYSLWSYDLDADSYTLLNDSNKTGAHIDYHMTGRVDPKRKLFIAVGGKGAAGGGMQVFDLASGSDHAQQDWTAQVSGCDGLLTANSPGWAYDAQQDRMIGWAGGDTIYSFDPDEKKCTTASHLGGPGAQHENGTFGRFRYFPALKIFALVNAYDRNGYVLRLSE
jgi:hypothetical protein